MATTMSSEAIEIARLKRQVGGRGGEIQRLRQRVKDLESAPSAISAFTVDQLLVELVRRRNALTAAEPVTEWCENCKHFELWTKRGDPPATYNPCKLKHAMEFRMPEDESPHPDPGTWGYFRRCCPDRNATPTALPIPQP